ncbi:hypothetical protein HOLleu_26439 [Holothuria leucospilota]|uniref:Uncharacterized protein n=1 Tax=Holothuria leucospilota TaxID=206669 RepID=A0A9Q1BP33_HOLLE|nr:hypothetical protein HOLleu_26439 [Holothuria leucospilota]
MCDKTDSFVTVTGMNIKHRKCAVLHGQRNITFPAKTLANMEDNIVKYIRGWFHLNKSSNRDIIFIPSSKGDLGVLSPSSMYVSKKLSFLLQALNSDDPQAKYSARSSFQLHMSKRKAVLHDANEGVSLFGGYGVDSGGGLSKGVRLIGLNVFGWNLMSFAFVRNFNWRSTMTCMPLSMHMTVYLKFSALLLHCPSTLNKLMLLGGLTGFVTFIHKEEYLESIVT